MTNIDFNNVQILAGTISGFTIGITSLIKQAGITSRFLPLASIIISVGLSVLIVGFTQSAVFIGLTASFLASGIYSGVKATVDKKEDTFNG